MSSKSEIPNGDFQDNDYKSRTGQNQIPVTSDDADIDDPIDSKTADSDEQLERDDRDAIDKENIIEDRTRGATKKSGTYAEPSDDVSEDGTSTGRQ